MDSLVAEEAGSFAATSREVALVLATITTGMEFETKSTVRTDYDVVVQHTMAVRSWRKKILSWVIKVSYEFSQNDETYAAAISFFDRLLSQIRVPAKHLQTMALACLFIASKLLERRHLRISQIRRHFTEICTCEELKRMELFILQQLNWDTYTFTAIDFIRSVLQLVPDAGIQSTIQQYAEDLFRHVVLDFDFVGCPASVLGMACIIVACDRTNFDAKPLIDGLSEKGILFDEPMLQAAVRLSVASISASAEESCASPTGTIADDSSVVASSPDSQASVAFTTPSLESEEINAFDSACEEIAPASIILEEGYCASRRLDCDETLLLPPCQEVEYVHDENAPIVDFSHYHPAQSRPFSSFAQL